MIGHKLYLINHKYVLLAQAYPNQRYLFTLHMCSTGFSLPSQRWLSHWRAWWEPVCCDWDALRQPTPYEGWV